MFAAPFRERMLGPVQVHPDPVIGWTSSVQTSNAQRKRIAVELRQTYDLTHPACDRRRRPGDRVADPRRQTIIWVKRLDEPGAFAPAKRSSGKLLERPAIALRIGHGERGGLNWTTRNLAGISLESLIR